MKTSIARFLIYHNLLHHILFSLTQTIEAPVRQAVGNPSSTYARQKAYAARGINKMRIKALQINQLISFRFQCINFCNKKILMCSIRRYIAISSKTIRVIVRVPYLYNVTTYKLMTIIESINKSIIGMPQLPN